MKEVNSMTGFYMVFKLSVFPIEHFDHILLGKSPIYKRNINFFFLNQGWDAIRPGPFPQTSARANVGARS